MKVLQKGPQNEAIKSEIHKIQTINFENGLVLKIIFHQNKTCKSLLISQILTNTYTTYHTILSFELVLIKKLSKLLVSEFL